MTAEDVLRLVDAFPWDEYNRDVKGEFADVAGHLVASQGRRAAARLGKTWDNDDPFVQKRLTGYVGDRIVQLDEATRGDVVDLIRREVESGISVGELGDKIADLVQEKFDGYADWRADRIARAETAILYNFGNCFGFRQAGVTHVRVLDGDDTDTDEACREANGQVWTIEEALNNPIAHPGCERDFVPITDDEE